MKSSKICLPCGAREYIRRGRAEASLRVTKPCDRRSVMMCERVDCSQPKSDCICCWVNWLQASASRTVILLNEILTGNDERATQRARRSKRCGRSISSGDIFSWRMVERMMSILRWREIESVGAATEFFSEGDDVIFVVKLFGVVDFLCADFAFADVGADGFSGTVEE